jgi:hypothetical protein
MKADDARRLAQDSELSEAVQKIVAEAPPLSDAKRDTLRHIFNAAHKESAHRSGRSPAVLTTDPGRHSQDHG